MKLIVLDMMKYSFIIFLLYVSFSFSQTKDEKEERIQKSNFPQKAQNYFYGVSKKVKHLKYYREIDGKKTSYEVKFKYKRLHYSIEFDPSGQLEDIEIIIEKKNIPKSVLFNISEYFETHYTKTRLLKIQKQYINTTKMKDENFILLIVKNPFDRNSHYEIIAETKTSTTRELNEFTFNEHGKFENSRKVIFSSYEHALY